MNYAELTVTTQDVPGEVSICFSITGCPLRCKGCHSPHLWKKESGQPLPHLDYVEILHRYRNMASCVLFMGGEWHPVALKSRLMEARKMGYKTCLYTGRDTLPETLLEELTWVKYGPWISQLGGLDQPGTNQRFVEVCTNEVNNHLFLNNSYATTHSYAD